MHHPLQVGITGGIGSGKSLISAIFSCLDIPVYDADTHAKLLMSSDAILIGQIKKEFGEKAYRTDGSLDRSYLSSVTFNNKERLEKLNSLVHPRVAVNYREWTRQHSNAPYLLREAALMYESKAYQTVDRMIVVFAPEELRIRRVLARDKQRSLEQVKAIIGNQLPEEEKLKRADHVIFNDDTKMVIPQVLELHKSFLKF